MNKKDIIKKVAENTGMTQKDVTVIVDTFVDAVMDSIKDGKVSISGFGTFEVVERAARMGRNPKTGMEIEIPASKSPKFKPAKAFKDSVNM